MCVVARAAGLSDPTLAANPGHRETRPGKRAAALGHPPGPRPPHRRQRSQRRQRRQGVAALFATPPVVQRFQLPTESFQHHGEADRGNDQPQGSRRRHQIFSQPVRAQAQRRRQSGGAGDPDLGTEFKRADADLRRRSLGLGADRQQQFRRIAALEPDPRRSQSPASTSWTGRYAADYPGNSIGGVLLVTTKMPDKFEATVKQTVSVQPWNQYGTKNTYLMHRDQRVGRQPQRRFIVAVQR